LSYRGIMNRSKRMIHEREEYPKQPLAYLIQFAYSSTFERTP